MSDTQYRIIESLNAVHNKLESLGAPMEAPEATSKSLTEINQKLISMSRSLQTMESVVKGLVDHIMQQGGVKNGASDIAVVLKEELHTLKNKMEDMDVSLVSPSPQLLPLLWIVDHQLTLPSIA